MSNGEEPLVQKIRFKDGTVERIGTSIRWKFNRDKKTYIMSSDVPLEQLPKTESEVISIAKPIIKPSNVINIVIKDTEDKTHVEKTKDGIVAYLNKGSHFSLTNPEHKHYKIMDMRKEKGKYNILRNGKSIPINVNDLVKKVNMK